MRWCAKLGFQASGLRGFVLFGFGIFLFGTEYTGYFLHLIWFSGWSTWWGGAAHRWHNSGSIAVLNRSLGHGFELLDLLFRDWIQGILDYNFISLFVLYVWLWEHILLSPWHLGPVTQYVLYLQTVWHHPSPGFQGINSKCIYIFILLFILNPPRLNESRSFGTEIWPKGRWSTWAHLRISWIWWKPHDLSANSPNLGRKKSTVLVWVGFGFMFSSL